MEMSKAFRVTAARTARLGDKSNPYQYIDHITKSGIWKVNLTDSQDYTSIRWNLRRAESNRQKIYESALAQKRKN